MLSTFQSFNQSTFNPERVNYKLKEVPDDDLFISASLLKQNFFKVWKSS